MHKETKWLAQQSVGILKQQLGSRVCHLNHYKMLFLLKNSDGEREKGEGRGKRRSYDERIRIMGRVYIVLWTLGFSFHFIFLPFVFRFLPINRAYFLSDGISVQYFGYLALALW